MKLRAEESQNPVMRQVSFASSVHHKGPVSQGMVLNVRDIARAPRITIDEPQVDLRSDDRSMLAFSWCHTHSTGHKLLIAPA